MSDVQDAHEVSGGGHRHPLAEVFSRVAAKEQGVYPEFRVLWIAPGTAPTQQQIADTIKLLGIDDLVIFADAAMTESGNDIVLAQALLSCDISVVAGSDPALDRYQRFAAYAQVPLLQLSSEETPDQIAARLALFYREPGLRRELVPEADNRAGLSFRIDGPFDSSYSLAMVNCHMAMALQEHAGATGLQPLEAVGTYPPHPGFIQNNPRVAALQVDGAAPATTVLRLMYPLGLGQMHGVNNGLCAYGWEESALPWDVVQQMNTRLTFATTMSSYVSQVLGNNGVTLPTFNVGIGADHILQAEPDAEALPELGEGLNFLHISSAFPRKGIDVLLQSWADAFTAKDNVTLVIKTFANPHHCIENMLTEWRKSHEEGADIVLLNEDLSAGAIRALYAACDVLVAPSRGEGFGLPLAEAMLHDMPVITTAYGGQRDFCTPETSWLLDYEFAPAATHMGLSDSVWAEPDGYQLQVLLQDFARAQMTDNWRSFTGTRTHNARQLIQHKFTWAAVAERMSHAVQTSDKLPVNPAPAKLAFVTTWNSKCGVAAYSQLLVKPAFDDYLIFADDNAEVLQSDEPNVIRCWTSGNPENPTRLLDAIIEQGIEQVHLQFNFAFFSPGGFKWLLAALHQRGIQTFMTCHSTRGGWQGDQPASLRALQPELNRVTRVFVHSINDLNLLKTQGVVDNVCLFPHGVINQAQGNSQKMTGGSEDPRWQNLKGKRVIASYGFLLPHKGIPQLIEAFNLLQNDYPDAHLLLMNALYPLPVSKDEAVRCRNLIRRHGLRDKVTLITDFLEDEESLAWLAQAEAVVFPYQDTSESSSAAVRWGLATGKPVYCTPLSIFSDVADAVTILPGAEPAAIAAGLGSAMTKSKEELGVLQDEQNRWLEEHDWRRLSQRLRHILRATQIEALLGKL